MTYSEILRKVPVAKSSLSLWLRSVVLAKGQRHQLTAKKRLAQMKGAAARHQQRIKLIQTIGKEAKQDMRRLDDSHLWLAGIMLYWAEGSKEKEYNIGQPTTFNNSDPKMIKLFIKWLTDVVKVPKKNIGFSIYIHETTNSEKALYFWSKNLSCDKKNIKVYFKRHKLHKIYRKNIGANYNGLLRVMVRKSVNLNRKIAAWVAHICKYWGVV